MGERRIGGRAPLPWEASNPAGLKARAVSSDRKWLFDKLGEPKERGVWGNEDGGPNRPNARWRCGCYANSHTAIDEQVPRTQWHLYPCPRHGDHVQR